MAKLIEPILAATDTSRLRQKRVMTGPGSIVGCVQSNSALSLASNDIMVLNTGPSPGEVGIIVLAGPETQSYKMDCFRYQDDGGDFRQDIRDRG